ncbi:peptidoglycan-binding domain-containing protein [Dryocola clanedunensis]|uniref:peptidoglycan-binding domain-containing protein n=1 Tax=Cedecea sulfonylureivorans TaxID=3051154 RepID=UPI0019271997|nr:peptidoglycan-binding domain-containing protein [Cedecea sulfonylureivorans]
MSILSGPAWCRAFPDSDSLLDLKFPFDTAVNNFITALKAAGARVSISATLHPPERAWLMHWAWMIAKGKIDPAQVPAKKGVDIQWVHETPEKSRQSAVAMVNAYGMQGLPVAPVLHSRYTEGHAIDIDISWVNNLRIKNKAGEYVEIVSFPRNAMNIELAQVGKSYGVMKCHDGGLDAPHWSVDGR